MNNKSIFERYKSLRFEAFLLLIILIGVIRLVVIFNERDGHHVDETWSYGFANSYYDPYIYTDNRTGITNGPEKVKNFETWISGEIFNDYLSVAPDERFSFDSVIYNKEEDLGPLLYEIILHFICSFFPDSFSWWYAFIFNLCLYVPTIILICLICYEITGSKTGGLFCAAYYVISGCGTGAFLYLRVYSLFVFLSVLLFYLMIRLLKYKTEHFNRLFFILPVVCLLGCLTHFYYLVAAFLFTFFGAIMLLLKKRWMDALRLCYVMLFSVMAFFGMYFQCVHVLLPHSTGEAAISYAFPYTWELATANMHFFMGTIGYYINFSVLLFLTVGGVVVFGAAFLGLIIFLFRNEKWMKSMLEKIRSFFKKLFDSAVRLLRSIDYCAYIALPVSILYMLILPKSASLVTMGYIERYFFPGMTIFLAFYISLVVKAVMSIKPSGVRNKLLIAFLGILIVLLDLRSNYYTNSFKFDDESEKELSAELSGRNVYVVFDNAARDMTWMSSILKDSNMVYIELTEFLNDEDTVFPELPDDCLVLVNTRGFLQEDEFGNPITEYDVLSMNLSKPHISISASQFIDELNDSTGRSYVYCDEYKCFIGDVRLYKCNVE